MKKYCLTMALLLIFLTSGIPKPMIGKIQWIRAYYRCILDDCIGEKPDPGPKSN
jgi:hypothetical protein